MKLFLFILFIFISFNVFSLNRDDFQITFSEGVLNQVLNKSLSNSKIKDSNIIFKREQFIFSAKYKLLFFEIPIKFIGNIHADDGDVLIDIYEYYQNGKKKDKKTTISRIKSMVEAINSVVNEYTDNVNIRAEYLKSDKSCGVLKLNLKNYAILPAIPSLKIKRVKLIDEFIIIASTDDIVDNNGAEIQAFIGDGVINALIKRFSGSNRINDMHIVGVDVKLFKDYSILKFNFEGGDLCTWLNINMDIKVPDLNMIELAIKNYQMDREDIDINIIVKKVISILNTNIANYRAPVRGEKLQFVYDDLKKKIKFNANFDDIIPLKIKPDIFTIKTYDGFIGIFAQII